MKKSTIAVLVFMFMLCFSACKDQSVNNNSQLLNSQMPLPFGENLDGGDYMVTFNHHCEEKFDAIPKALQVLVSDERAVEDFFGKFSFDVAKSSILDVLNIYTFKEHFKISNEEFTKVMRNLSEIYINTGRPEMAMTDEEIEIICEGNIEEISKAFVSQYSINVGDKIFTPHWLYTNSKDEYARVGISVEKVREKIELFSNLNLTSSAFKAFENKLSGYIGQKVQLG